MKNKKLKNVICTGLASVMLLSATGCSSTNDEASTPNTDTEKEVVTTPEVVKLTVWAPTDEQEIVGEMIETFKTENPDKTYDITLRPVDEGGAREEVLKDIEAAGDLFVIPHDQVGALVAAGALYENTKYVQEVTDNNIEIAVNAATYEGKMYGYPFANDTYYLTYDKSKLSAEDVQSLESILNKENGADVVNFGNDFGSAYVSTSFFFANGTQLFGETGQEADVVTFNSPEGLEVGNYIATLQDQSTISINSDIAANMFKEGTLGSYIAGPWKAETYKEALGENYAVAKLPTVDFGNGDKQMISFGGVKMFTVKSTTAFPEDAMELAAFLTNEENQMKRFTERSLLPSNKVVASRDEILNDETMKTVMEQLNYSIAMPASPQMSRFWTPMAAFIKNDYEGLIPEEEMQSKLDALVSDILSE